MAPGSGAAWCAEYNFFTTTGAYSPHARAGDAWADIRLLVDASVREAMDTLLAGLIWGADPADDPALTGGGGFFPPSTGRGLPHVLLVCPPEAVPGKARAWQQVEPHLEKLREPFAAECEGWAGRPAAKRPARGVRDARTVPQPGLAVRVVPVLPLGQTGAGDTGLGGDVDDQTGVATFDELSVSPNVQGTFACVTGAPRCFGRPQRPCGGGTR